MANICRHTNIDAARTVERNGQTDDGWTGAGTDKRSNGMKTFYTCFNARDEPRGEVGAKGNRIEVKLKPFANSC